MCCELTNAAYEVFERMAYYGISTNLIIYLTTKLRQGTVTSANNVTNWVGTIWITPIFGAYVADAHLGRYFTFVLAALIYLSVTIFPLHTSFLIRPLVLVWEVLKKIDFLSIFPRAHIKLLPNTYL